MLIADKGYDADRIREKVEAHGGVPVIPMRRNRKIQEPLDTVLYAWRNLVERCFKRLNHTRRRATRYDKAAASVLGIHRLHPPLAALFVNMTYVHDVSSRSVDDLAKAMGAGGMSKSQVGRLCADIDERANEFLTRPLEGAWPYLWLDATHVKVREGGRIVSRAVIVAFAVNEDGKREVLGVATGPSEAETFWTGFLRGVKLVIADNHKGLRAAARRVFNTTHQRCRIHWMRNALGHAPAKERTAVAAMLKTIFAQETKAEAQARWDTVANALREKQDKLGGLIDASRDHVLA